MQFDTTINDWHTSPGERTDQRIESLSEFMSIDDSACNLASLNLLRFVHSDGEIRRRAVPRRVEVVFTAQDILVGYSDYPTAKIAETRARTASSVSATPTSARCSCSVGFPMTQTRTRLRRGDTAL